MDRRHQAKIVAARRAELMIQYLAQKDQRRKFGRKR